MTTTLWVILLVVVAAVMFVFGVWWTKRHPNESQRYYADFEQVRTGIEATVKQQTDKIATVVDSLDQRITVVEQSAAAVQQSSSELSTILASIKSGLIKLGATPETATPAPANIIVPDDQK